MSSLVSVSFIVTLPTDEILIFSVAASDAPVLKASFVALLLALKSPSDTAAISAATKMASVPAASSGAWNCIFPKASLSAMSVSPVCTSKTNGVSSAVDVFLNVSPESCTWVIFTSVFTPNPKIEASDNSVKSSPMVASPVTVRLEIINGSVPLTWTCIIWTVLVVFKIPINILPAACWPAVSAAPLSCKAIAVRPEIATVVAVVFVLPLAIHTKRCPAA